MIVVLGPPTLLDAVSAACPDELVVGAREDERLATPGADAAATAAGLPMAVRACVVPADRSPAETCGAVRNAGGSLTSSRLVVVGDPPPGMPPTAWETFVGNLGALPLRDASRLGNALASTPVVGRRPVAGPSWREALHPSPRRVAPALLPLRPNLNPGIDEDELDAVIRRPLSSDSRTIAVISPKGGVGKTLLSFLLGSVLARVRRDHVIAVDSNPDFGTLADLASEPVPATMVDLLRDLPAIGTAAALSSFTTPTESGLEILGAPQDPSEMSRLGSSAYRAVHGLLADHYDLVVFDCGTGFLDDVTQYALRTADHVVLVTTPVLVTTKVILGGLEHLRRSGFDLRRLTLAVNQVRRDDHLDRRRLRRAVEGRVGGLVEIPFDRRLHRDVDLGRFRFDRLASPTRVAVKRLAAQVVAQLPDLLVEQATA